MNSRGRLTEEPRLFSGVEKERRVVEVGDGFVRSTVSVLGEADQLSRMDEFQMSVVTWQLNFICLHIRVVILGLVV